MIRQSSPLEVYTQDSALISIYLDIRNDTEARKMDYEGWAARFSFGGDKPGAKLTDEFGNRYKIIDFGFGGSSSHQHFNEAIHPGTTLRDMLVFEKPIGRAKEWRLELPGETIGAKGVFRIRVPAP
jgi:hypothetical protein